MHLGVRLLVRLKCEVPVVDGGHDCWKLDPVGSGHHIDLQVSSIEEWERAVASCDRAAQA